MRKLDREQAAAALAQGEAVVLPTDTVYGVGVAVGTVDDPTALFRLKGRPAGKPVTRLVAGTDELDRYGRAVPARPAVSPSDSGLEGSLWWNRPPTRCLRASAGRRARSACACPPSFRPSICCAPWERLWPRIHHK